MLDTILELRNIYFVREEIRSFFVSVIQIQGEKDLFKSKHTDFFGPVSRPDQKSPCVYF